MRHRLNSFRQFRTQFYDITKERATQSFVEKIKRYCFDRAIWTDDFEVVIGLCHTWESHLDIIDYERNSLVRKTCIACVTRYARIHSPCRRVRQRPNQYLHAFDVLYTPYMPCVYGYFNEVVHCAKTKLDNFIAIALARSTSIIFHYVSFPFRPPLHLTD